MDLEKGDGGGEDIRSVTNLPGERVKDIRNVIYLVKGLLLLLLTVLLSIYHMRYSNSIVEHISHAYISISRCLC